MAQAPIDALRNQFMEAFNRFDAASVAACYTEDAKFMCPNTPMIIGRTGIQGFTSGARDMGMQGLRLEALEVFQEGNLATEVGRYVADVRAKEGQAAQDVGKYVVIFRRQADGSWKIAAHIFNCDSPPPGQ